jgi:hypothetical protein
MARHRRRVYCGAMKATPSAPALPPPTREQIAALAYAIWQDRGCPIGNDLDIWLEAERQLQDESSGRRSLAADDIPAAPGDPDRDPAVDGGEVEAELDRIAAPPAPRSPTSL